MSDLYDEEARQLAVRNARNTPKEVEQTEEVKPRNAPVFVPRCFGGPHTAATPLDYAAEIEAFNARRRRVGLPT